MYPCQSIEGLHTLHVNFDPPKFEEIQLPNGLILIVDSDYARNMPTHRPCHHMQALIQGMVLDWENEHQRCVALHTETN